MGIVMARLRILLVASSLKLEALRVSSAERAEAFRLLTSTPTW